MVTGHLVLQYVTDGMDTQWEWWPRERMCVWHSDSMGERNAGMQA